MSKILAVFGATGQQGGSVIAHVLDDPQLAATYRVRAITRDVSSTSAAQLRARGVDVMRGDADDRASLDTALAGVNTVFAMTMPAHGAPTAEEAVEAEVRAARNIADAALAQHVAFFVFSSLPSPAAFSDGKYAGFLPAEAKARAELYIRSLAFADGVAFFAPAYFMQNFVAAPFIPLLPDATPTTPATATTAAATTASGDSSNDSTISPRHWSLVSHLPPSARLALIDVAADSGRFVGAILANPQRYRGKTVCAAAGQFSMTDIAAAMAAATAADIVYRQASLDDYRAAIPPFVAGFLPDGLSAWTEFGYYGPDSDRVIAQALDGLDGSHVTSPTEFFAAHPPKLE